MTVRAEHPRDAALPTGLLAGDRRAVARAISRIEQGAPEAAALKAALVPHLGRAQVIGLTGAPGAGKSTLVHAMLGELLARGRRIGVVAVDPSSPITGGAVLGDRVRMGEHGAHENVFIRSVASRGHLGGLSKSTSEIVDVLDAAGFDTILIETVGAGQSEVEIMRVADTRIVVSPPGLGDDVQAIKAGIIEIADLLVVNKADLPQAERTVLDLTTATHLRHRADWKVQVLKTVATSGEGVAALVDAIGEHAAATGIGKRLKQPSHPQTGEGSKSAAPQVTDDELFAQLRRWRAAGKRVALATVVKTWGSSPRPEGSHLAVEEGGAFVGSVSGGCIEGAVIGEAQAAIADGQPRLLEFGVSDERAWEVGLACGGRVQVFVERVG